jgi:very-short-patch-repair endonuclease
VDKDNPARYRLGIICDGENYRRAKTVRDREIVQQGALKTLGWKILKIWTLDWWENPGGVLDSIEAALHEEAAPGESEPAAKDAAPRDSAGGG